MDDAVIDALRAAYHDQGYSTLRFNYRGVGGSEGTPDCDAGAREDLASALAYLAGRGKRRLDVAGYSFGAWVAFVTAQSAAEARRAILVAPPIDVVEFSGASDKIRLVVSDALAAALADRAARPRSSARLPHESLSSREFQVFMMLAEGTPLKEIAAHLSVARTTIASYRTRVLEKMGMTRNSDLVRYALKNGLVT
jgi:DNA-binding CsgD family transcriptional regulator